MSILGKNYPYSKKLSGKIERLEELGFSEESKEIKSEIENIISSFKDNHKMYIELKKIHIKAKSLIPLSDTTKERQKQFLEYREKLSNCPMPMPNKKAHIRDKYFCTLFNKEYIHEKFDLKKPFSQKAHKKAKKIFDNDLANNQRFDFLIKKYQNSQMRSSGLSKILHFIISESGLINQHRILITQTPNIIDALIFELHNKLKDSTENPRTNTPEENQIILNNSHDIAKETVLDTMIKLPLKDDEYQKPFQITNIDTIDEFERYKIQNSDLFTNKVRYAKLKQGNHYLSFILDDIISEYKDGRKVFKNYTTGLTYGFFSYGIALYITDNKKAIREAEKYIDAFKAYEDNEKIEFTGKFINFLKSQKYAKYLPFKAIAQYCDIPVSKTKNYISHMLNDASAKSYEKNHELINLYPKELDIQIA